MLLLEFDPDSPETAPNLEFHPYEFQHLDTRLFLFFRNFALIYWGTAQYEISTKNFGRKAAL